MILIRIGNLDVDGDAPRRREGGNCLRIDLVSGGCVEQLPIDA